MFYFLALLKEFTGKDKELYFSNITTPQHIEDLYDLFDYLTIDSIKSVVSSCRINIPHKLRKGNELMFMGLPVRLSKEGTQVVIDQSRIQLDQALFISTKTN